MVNMQESVGITSLPPVERKPPELCRQTTYPNHTNLLAAFSIVSSTSYPFLIADGLKKQTGFTVCCCCCCCFFASLLQLASECMLWRTAATIARSFVSFPLVSRPLLRPTMLFMFPRWSQLCRSHHIVRWCEWILHEVHVRLIGSARSRTADGAMIIHLKLLEMIRYMNVIHVLSVHPCWCKPR